MPAPFRFVVVINFAGKLNPVLRAIGTNSECLNLRYGCIVPAQEPSSLPRAYLAGHESPQQWLSAVPLSPSGLEWDRITSMPIDANRP